MTLYDELENERTEEEFDWSVLSFVSGILKEFRNTDNMKYAVEQILRKIGTLYQADRAYIVLFSEDGQTALTWCQWNRPGVPVLDAVSISAKQHIFDFFRADGLAVYDSLEQVKPEPARCFLERCDVKATLQGLLIKNETCFGWIAIDDCKEKRHWRAQEIELLQTSVMLLRERIPPLMK